MALSKEEKAAGRQFRDQSQVVLDALNERFPPGIRALVYWRVVRHECPAQRGASVGITLREHYELNDEWLEPGSGKVLLAAGQLAFIWKEGTCSGSGCGLTVRTAQGRIVVAADRPADRERTRVERREASAHP